MANIVMAYIVMVLGLLRRHEVVDGMPSLRPVACVWPMAEGL